MAALEAKLLKMGEQIVLNCSFADDENAVIDKVADHLQRFWDPRMRQAIKATLSEKPESATKVLQHAVSKLVI